MKRRLPNLLTGLSLLLCVALCVLWVRSYWVADGVQWTGMEAADTQITERTRRVTSHRGQINLHFMWHHRLFHTPGDAARLRAARESATGWGWSAKPPHPDTQSSLDWIGGGFLYGTRSAHAAPGHGRVAYGGGFMPLKDELEEQWWVLVPHWAVVLGTTMLPVAWLARHLRVRRRRRAGLCPACGYDLRATPGHCPECGFTSGGAKA